MTTMRIFLTFFTKAYVVGTHIHAIPHTVRQNLTEFGYFATHFP